MVRSFKCPHCEKGFASNYELKSHLQVHENRPSAFSCDVCDKKFRRLKNLVLHQKRHLKQYVVKCKECDQGFVCQGDYVQHLRNRHEVDRERVVCFICGKEVTKGQFNKITSNGIFYYFYYQVTTSATWKTVTENEENFLAKCAAKCLREKLVINDTRKYFTILLFKCVIFVAENFAGNKV